MKLTFSPVKMHLPLKFGMETIESIQIAHVELDAYGARGIGETPLSEGCWTKEHGMLLMVQDLTNPMLATIPHVLPAAHVGTVR